MAIQNKFPHGILPVAGGTATYQVAEGQSLKVGDFVELLPDGKVGLFVGQSNDALIGVATEDAVSGNEVDVCVPGVS